MNPSEPILLTKGNLPLIRDSLIDGAGAPVNLTNCTLQFAFQAVSIGTAPVQFTHAASVVTPLTGAVSYQFAAGETDVVGDYQAQWIVTPDSGPVAVYPFPAGRIPFQIVEPLPQVSPSNIILLRQMFEPVRATLGDFNSQFRKYKDEAILSVLRACLMVGKVPGQTLTPDRQGITPGIVLPSQMALLMYHSAKMFLAPNVADYRYETRAMSEKFGRQDTFYFELCNAIYSLENGEMFSSFQSFYAWVNSLTGIDIWSVLSDMKTSAPVATVNIGRAGITVTTS